ncbi:MAG: flavoprotein [Actinomycetota bacterium]
MTSFRSGPGRVLYLVVSAAPQCLDTLARIEAEQADGWDVCAVLTPQAAAWLDVDAIEAATGHPVQSRMRIHPEPLFEPLGNAVLAAPVTFNTLNKVAIGMADNMATGLLCEALGRDVPVAMEPRVSDAFARHPAFRQHVERLRAAGVTFTWHDPHTRAMFPED